jgi:uncharacterized sulfatase
VSYCWSTCYTTVAFRLVLAVSFHLLWIGNGQATEPPGRRIDEAETTASRPLATPPNIVFILIDDMGWPDVGCYGHPFHETPHIDQLAAQGMRFTSFYAATPVCSSTRSTIQSGQYSARTGITDFIPGHWRKYARLTVPPIDHHLREGIRTPGHLLHDSGYATAYFGKWHLGDAPDDLPDDWGYQITNEQLGAAFENWRSGRPPGPKQIDLLTDQAIYFMESHRRQPFFVTISHHAVHIPVEGTAAAVAKYSAKARPETGVNNPIYAAMIEHLDQSIGRLLGKLDEWDLTERTIVIFTSDNGGLHRIYTGVGDLISTNAPLRDEKGTLYEGGIRVPLIIKWPGVARPGTVCDEPATTADLLPTFCAMAGAELPPQAIDGLSLLPLLSGEGTRLTRDAIYFHYPHYHHAKPAGAIRAGRWKLLESFEDGTLELYDLDSDIGETRNLAGAEPARAQQLQSKLAAWRTSVGARMPVPNPDFDPARAHQWWNRNSNSPLDIEAMRRQYESRTQK